FFFSRPGLTDIDGWEEPLVGQTAIEMDFHVAGSFELFKYNIIHPATSIDKCRRHDGETAAVFDVAGRSKEPLRTLKRIRVQSSRQDLAAWRRNGIVGTRQAGNAVQQHDDVFLMFDQPFCFFKDHLSYLSMALTGSTEDETDALGFHLPVLF